MQPDREQFWLIAACVIAVHAAALAVTTIGWGLSGAGVFRAPKSVEAAIADPVVIVRNVEPPDVNALGEEGGRGNSIATVEAPRPAVSDKPDDIDQAWTRRKPVPLPQPAAEKAAEQRATPEALGPTSVTAVSPLAIMGEAAETPDEKAAEEKAPEPEQKPSEQPPAEKAEEVKPFEAKPDPATAGESDLDPFTTEEGVSFSPGGTVARQGRDVKIARPRVDLGFMAEATRISGRDLSVRMLIETDAVGHPARVRVLESSGSDVIDDAVRLAMYDSWFGGKTPDRFPFTVTFVRR